MSDTHRGEAVVTKPLPTLADIDGDLARAHDTKARVLAAVEANDEETAGFLVDLVTLDETVDGLLELRSQIAALIPHA